MGATHPRIAHKPSCEQFKTSKNLGIVRRNNKYTRDKD